MIACTTSNLSCWNFLFVAPWIHLLLFDLFFPLFFCTLFNIECMKRTFNVMYASIYVIFDVHTFYRRVKNETMRCVFGRRAGAAEFLLLLLSFICCIYMYNSLRINGAHKIHFFLPVYLNEYKLKQLKRKLMAHSWWNCSDVVEWHDVNVFKD